MQKIYFKISTIPILSDLILAPMEGFSDFPYRNITRKMGSGISCTEFVNAMDVINGHPYLLKERLAYQESERPIVFQIYDNDPQRIIQAAHKLRTLNPDMIDINMGCSAKTVSTRGAGAGLLLYPEKIALIFYTLSRQLDLPITGKIRLGWDSKSLNYLDIAKIIQDNGGAMIAVHGRTRQQGFTGTADWDSIARIKQAVQIPVIGNGDVRTLDDITRLKTQTGCDAVMIGRGAIGNPWIFSRLDRNQIHPADYLNMIHEHLTQMILFYGQERGIIFFRKHLVEYIQPLKKLSRENRKMLFSCTDPEKVIGMLKDLLLTD